MFFRLQRTTLFFFLLSAFFSNITDAQGQYPILPRHVRVSDNSTAKMNDSSNSALNDGFYVAGSGGQFDNENIVIDDRLFDKQVYHQLGEKWEVDGDLIGKRFIGKTLHGQQVAKIALDRFVQAARDLGIQSKDITRAMFEGAFNPYFEDVKLAYEGLTIDHLKEMGILKPTEISSDEGHMKGSVILLKNKWWNSAFGEIEDIGVVETIVNGQEGLLLTAQDIGLRYVMRLYENQFKKVFGIEVKIDPDFRDTIERLEATNLNLMKILKREVHTLIKNKSAFQYFSLTGLDSTSGFNLRRDYESLRERRYLPLLQKLALKKINSRQVTNNEKPSSGDEIRLEPEIEESSSREPIRLRPPRKIDLVSLPIGMKVALREYTIGGVEIQAIESPSIAQEESLQVGDVIITVDDVRVSDRLSGEEVVNRHCKSGLKLNIYRNLSLDDKGRVYRIAQKFLYTIDNPSLEVVRRRRFKGKMLCNLGVSIETRTLTFAITTIKEVTPGSIAEESGLKKDDLIISANNELSFISPNTLVQVFQRFDVKDITLEIERIGLDETFSVTLIEPKVIPPITLTEIRLVPPKDIDESSPVPLNEEVPKQVIKQKPKQEPAPVTETLPPQKLPAPSISETTFPGAKIFPFGRNAIRDPNLIREAVATIQEVLNKVLDPQEVTGALDSETKKNIDIYIADIQRNPVWSWNVGANGLGIYTEAFHIHVQQKNREGDWDGPQKDFVIGLESFLSAVRYLLDSGVFKQFCSTGNGWTLTILNGLFWEFADEYLAWKKAEKGYDFKEIRDEYACDIEAVETESPILTFIATFIGTLLSPIGLFLEVFGAWMYRKQPKKAAWFAFKVEFIEGVVAFFGMTFTAGLFPLKRSLFPIFMIPIGASIVYFAVLWKLDKSFRDDVENKVKGLLIIIVLLFIAYSVYTN